ncbi:MAG: GNAT family N-acetyltransferase [Clostridia bacterium]|nr:GNAT family N-acetyltransferase [Clostridia bacterium]
MTKEDLKIFTKIPRIHTERLELREITTSDLADVNEYATDPEVSRYLLWSPHRDTTHTKLYLNNIRAKYKRAEFYDWGVVYGGKMIGTCGFTAFDISNNSAEIGYVLNRRFWGMGIGYEAARAVMKFGFDRLGLERIEVRFMTDNLASEALAKRCGMKREGTLRRAILAKGEYRDIGICSILRNEYHEEI